MKKNKVIEQGLNDLGYHQFDDCKRWYKTQATLKQTVTALLDHLDLEVEVIEWSKKVVVKKKKEVRNE